MLTFQIEKLDALLADGAEELLWAHWEETETDRDTIPLALDFDHYRALEKAGGYLILGARAEGRPVGYNSFFLSPLPKFRHTTFAVNDGFYLAPEWRRGWNGVGLIRAAEEPVRQSGAKRIIYAINDAVRIGRRGKTLGDLMTLLGYGKRGEVFSRLM